MTDRYTKTVLTIIALTLAGMLAAQLTPLAHAQTDGQCGAVSHPCYVKSDMPLYVHVVPPLP